jgi:hypothetical protein
MSWSFWALIMNQWISQLLILLYALFCATARSEPWSPPLERFSKSLLGQAVGLHRWGIRPSQGFCSVEERGETSMPQAGLEPKFLCVGAPQDARVVHVHSSWQQPLQCCRAAQREATVQYMLISWGHMLRYKTELRPYRAVCNTSDVAVSTAKGKGWHAAAPDTCCPLQYHFTRSSAHSGDILFQVLHKT